MIKILLILLIFFTFNTPVGAAESLNFRELLGEFDNNGFERAMEKRAFHFPHDHGPHPSFRTEWWYFTGNLETREGRKFGYELSLFRFALDSNPVERTSKWATKNVYMGHFALTDVETGRFYSFERFARDGAGLAGAKADPFKVWVEEWTVEETGEDKQRWRLKARKEDMAVSFLLTPKKPVVLQGDEGLSRKSSEPGNASYYYSIPRLLTTGVITIEGTDFETAGTSWFDREWSTSALSEEQAGWDWFALQLSNGYDLIYYRLRLNNGGTDPFSAGKLIGPDGSAVSLAKEDVALEVLEKWESPLGGAYPVHWKLRVKKEALSLAIEPLIVNQELNLSVRYWEGAVQAKGVFKGEDISGKGYLEMTGYTGD